MSRESKYDLFTQSRAEKDSHKSASKGKESRIGATTLTQPDPALKCGTGIHTDQPGQLDTADALAFSSPTFCKI